MQPRVEKSGNTLHVFLQGRIDHSNADEFKENLLTALEARSDTIVSLVVELEEVDYMSSLGLRMLIIIRNHASKMGINTILSNPRDVLSEILKISQFDKIFPIRIGE